jgi:hypothetical protein
MKTCDKYRGVDIKQWRELFAGVNSDSSETPKASSRLQAAKQLKYRSADIKQWRKLFGAVNSYALVN